MARENKQSLCVLLIHGFGGSKNELTPLYKLLQSKGIPVYNAFIAGHTGRYHDFFSSTRSDWIGSVEKKLSTLYEQHDHVVLVGFSMGGLIATHMMDYPISGVIFANTPIYFCDYTQIIRNFEREFWKYAKKYLSATIKTPPTALSELVALLAETKDVGFQKVRCPALILQTLDDDTAHYKSANAIAKRVSGLKRMVLYPQGGHKIFGGNCSEQACQQSLQFIETTSQAINRQPL